MMRTTLGAILVTALTTPLSAEYRVVVQEAQAVYGHSLHKTPDGKVAWLVGGSGHHILQIIDPAAQLVVRRYFLPDQMLSQIDAVADRCCRR